MSTQHSVKSRTTAKHKKATTKLEPAAPSREKIALLAEKYWVESGRPEGFAEQNWLRAEKELAGAAS